MSRVAKIGRDAWRRYWLRLAARVTYLLTATAVGTIFAG